MPHRTAAQDADAQLRVQQHQVDRRLAGLVVFRVESVSSLLRSIRVPNRSLTPGAATFQLSFDFWNNEEDAVYDKL